MPKSRHLTIITILSLIISAAICIAGLVFITRGFDFTDTGFYLLTTAFPEGVRLRMSFFDYFNQPLYTLSGERVGAIRLAATMLLYANSVLVLFFTGHTIFNPTHRKIFFAYSPLLMIAALVSVLHLPTPAYNYWGLIALQFAWMGLWLWLRKPLTVREASLATFLLGVGTVQLLGARPTTIVGLFLIFLVVTALRGELPQKPHIWLASGLLGMLPTTVYLLVMSNIFGLTVEDLQQSLELAVHWKTVTNPVPLQLSAYIGSILTLFAEAALLLFAFWIFWGVAAFSRWRARSQEQIPQAVYIWVAVAWVVGTMSGLWALQRSPSIMGSIAAQFFLMSVTTLPLLSNAPQGEDQASRRRVWIGAAVAMSLLVIASFGTNVGYGLISGMAYFLGCLAVLLLLTRPQPKRWLQTLMIGALFLTTAIAAYHGLRLPRREDASRWEMTTPVDIRQGRDQILVSPAMAAYIAAFTQTAGEAGFEAGTPVMDFTGHRPGLVYAMGGRSPAYGWFLGGYPGSTEAVASVLDQWSEADLQAAWLITAEGEAERALPTSLLDEYDLNFPEDYQRLGTFLDPIVGETYVLWQPITAD